jgi:hypothetical protein
MTEDIHPSTNSYSSIVENETLFPYLYKTIDEYKRLDSETKRKYMKVLTEWYMREKDALNRIEYK